MKLLISQQKCKVGGMSTEELTQFALNHKNEFQRSTKSDGLRSSAKPSSVPSVNEVKAMLEQNQSAPPKSAPPSSRRLSSGPPPSIPPLSPPPLTPPHPTQTEFSNDAPPSFTPVRRASQPPSTKPLSLPTKRDDAQSTPKVESSSSVLRKNSETRNIETFSNSQQNTIISRMESMQDHSNDLENRLNVALKHIKVLQKDLDNEINQRKLLETELHRLKSIVDVINN